MREEFLSENFMTEEEFKQRLRDAGWKEDEIEQEWKDIQNDDESGYDGP